jgi:type II secretory pathway component PulM
MKASLKPRTRPSPTDAVRIATQAAPSLPPTRLSAEDRSQAFNMRLKASTLAALEARARADGATLKQVICRSLAAAGVEVAPADLEDGTPRRRFAA